MGDYSPPETPKEMIKTLRRLVADDTFRLSLNEQAAIAYALRRITRKNAIIPFTSVWNRSHTMSDFNHGVPLCTTHCISSFLDWVLE